MLCAMESIFLRCSYIFVGGCTHLLSDYSPHCSKLSLTMFTNAKNTSILGGNFTVNTRDEETHGIAQVMNMLKIYISPGAMHDSAVRSDVPKCHEDTRVAIVEKLCVWRLSAGRPFLWMYGPAGCGKTTIAQTIAEKFDNDGTLAASFFFSRSAPGRPSSKDQFVATIAYQLCLALPNFHSHISRVLLDNPAIFNKSLSKQAGELIIKPLKAFAASHTDTVFTPRVILIDGLDECAPSESQKEILDVMAHCQRQSPIPLMFLISSRPEAIIRTCFSHGSLGPLTEVVLPGAEGASRWSEVKFNLCPNRAWSLNSTPPRSLAPCPMRFPK
ncbi:hypothetical protein D9619_011619 [Psilocybe cf. subviscida]|uniref:Nephrocystin 3-like N-terminal domain-containing protein n=1 Tax=Psilocybe cf. subviscida TaxID=2480587 RepID=A0A8H5BSB1_9AGAR|nr:hypothetical protein D9619_011619 [Psilocybe cf. subviscida]